MGRPKRTRKTDENEAPPKKKIIPNQEDGSEEEEPVKRSAAGRPIRKATGNNANTLASFVGEQVKRDEPVLSQRQQQFVATEPENPRAPPVKATGRKKASTNDKTQAVVPRRPVPRMPTAQEQAMQGETPAAQPPPEKAVAQADQPPATQVPCQPPVMQVQNQTPPATQQPYQPPAAAPAPQPATQQSYQPPAVQQQTPPATQQPYQPPAPQQQYQPPAFQQQFQPPAFQQQYQPAALQQQNGQQSYNGQMQVGTPNFAPTMQTLDFNAPPDSRIMELAGRQATIPTQKEMYDRDESLRRAATGPTAFTPAPNHPSSLSTLDFNAGTVFGSSDVNQGYEMEAQLDNDLAAEMEMLKQRMELLRQRQLNSAPAATEPMIAPYQWEMNGPAPVQAVQQMPTAQQGNGTGLAAEPGRVNIPPQEVSNNGAPVNTVDVSGTEDVLASHRKRNKSSRAPPISFFQPAATSEVISSPSTGSQDSLATATTSPAISTPGSNEELSSPTGRAPRNSKKTADTRAKPTNIGFYAKSPLWWGTIQEGKNRYDLHIAVKDGFPDTQFDKHEAEGILSKVIEERNTASDTRFVFNEKMVSILTNQRSGLRGRLRDEARRSIRAVFADVFLDPITKEPKEGWEVKPQVERLIHNAEWNHWNVETSGGAVVNCRFTHPVIKNCIIEFFYKKKKNLPSLASSYPEWFRDTVPIRVVALTVISMDHIFSDYEATGEDEKATFSAFKYASLYEDLVGVITELCDGVTPEGIGMKSSYRAWARDGMNKIKNGGAEACTVRKQAFRTPPQQPGAMATGG